MTELEALAAVIATDGTSDLDSDSDRAAIVKRFIDWVTIDVEASIPVLQEFRQQWDRFERLALDLHGTLDRFAAALRSTPRS